MSKHADNDIIELEVVDDKAALPAVRVRPETLAISARIRQLTHEKGFRSLESVRLKTRLPSTGNRIDSANWSRYMNGVRSWGPNALMAVAEVLETTVDFLRGCRPPIPNVWEASAYEKFTYKEGGWTEDEIVGYVDNPFGEDEEKLKKIYALTAKKEGMLPFAAGTIFYVKKDPQPEEFQDYDWVVWVDNQGRAQLRQLILKPEHIILRGANPAVSEETLPRRHLKSCDLVFQIVRPGINPFS